MTYILPRILQLIGWIGLRTKSAKRRYKTVLLDVGGHYTYTFLHNLGDFWHFWDRLGKFHCFNSEVEGARDVVAIQTVAVSLRWHFLLDKERVVNRADLQKVAYGTNAICGNFETLWKFANMNTTKQRRYFLSSQF